MTVDNWKIRSTSFARFCGFVIYVSLTTQESNAFSLSVTHGRHSKGGRKARVSLQSSSDVMGGSDEFESWWKKSQGSLPPNLRHGSFESDTLRGLEYVATEENKSSDVLTLPSSLVLSSPFITNNEEDITSEWDVSLSTSLLKECMAGKSSPLYGYCALLCQGTSFSEGTPCPPWTAPNSLRHWTAFQLEVLEESSRGKKLIQAMEKQKANWSKKYKALENPGFSEEQFVWAMEAVHSRAFCGDFGFVSNSILKKLSTLLIPVSFGALGLSSVVLQRNDDNLVLAVLLALLGASPILFKWLDDALMPGDSKGDAVLLPFIDSANHVEDAQSILEFDPVKNAFSLSIGRKCIKKDKTNNKRQLFISYGAKGDSELLLNYGFLPGLSSVENEDNSDFRKRLAEAYIN